MYNNPMYYNSFFPYNNISRDSTILKKGFGFKNINWSNILNNTQKTLNVINQAIPVYYQIKPIWGNAKTMFRMIGALKDDNNPKEPQKKIEKNTSEQGPVFFL